MNKVPVTKVSRSLVVGKAILKIGATQTKGFVKKRLSSKDKKDLTQSVTDAQTAQIIIDSLGLLKGVSVKIAQQVALGMPFLPQEYLDKISQSFSAIPPINRALIRKIIKQELDNYPHEVFEEFESEPFGAASLGQVHLATYSGNKVAVKVQYPGMAKSIESDISIIKFAMMRFSNGQSVDHLIDEINAHLQEEIDYTIEAKNTTFFYNNLSSEDIVIPKVILEVSTSKVLTTEFLEGMSFEKFLASNPTQEKKDSFAQKIFDTFFISLYSLKQIHADPNPGNFIFMNDGGLGIIDFGCVKKIDENFLHSFNKLHLLLINKADDEEIVFQYVELNMIDRSDMKDMLNFYREVIKPLDNIYIEIFYEDSYDFKQNKNFSRRGFDAIMEVQKKQLHSVNHLNEEYIFLDRTLLGYYSMFEKMGAKIDTTMVKNLIKEYEL